MKPETKRDWGVALLILGVLAFILCMPGGGAFLGFAIGLFAVLCVVVFLIEGILRP